VKPGELVKKLVTEGGPDFSGRVEAEVIWVNSDHKREAAHGITLVDTDSLLVSPADEGDYLTPEGQRHSRDIARSMNKGEEIPALTVLTKPGGLMLYDGYHRWNAAKMIGLNQVGVHIVGPNITIK
jgi:hypothetical protein